jgi:meso-butanediol dehydrogenase/(S,S)-butanediol dehydrogenase/diacetyl reductase
VLVNNVGAGVPGKVTEVLPEEWLESINVCLSATYMACRYAIPHMIAGGGGAIVNIASTAGLGGDYGMAAYNSAKAAVINLTRSMAVDHALDGIRVNAVCPGVTETPATLRMRRVPGLWDAHMHTIPMRRAGKPTELAAAIVFLTSDDASYITGAVLPVDGGKTAWSGSPDMTEFLAAATARS